jgi:hypothetical protein
MQYEVTHAYPLAFWYHRAHFDNFRVRAQDYGNHELPWAIWVVFGVR